jgi:hypothetical protein
MHTWDDSPPEFVSSEKREWLAQRRKDREEREARARKDREAQASRARRWEGRFDRWGLTDDERLLFLALGDGHGHGSRSRTYLLRVLYDIRLHDGLAEKVKRKHLARLRKLQQRLTDRLLAAEAPFRVAPAKPDDLALIDLARERAAKPGKPRAFPGGLEWLRQLWSQKRWEAGLPMYVDECQNRLREILAAGEVPTWRVWKQLKQEGCREGVFKQARKRLGVVAVRRGFGGDGEWLLRLPV